MVDGLDGLRLDAFVCGDPEKALRRYEQAVRVRPEDFQAPLLMAQIYADLGRENEAELARRRGVQLAEEHLALNPDDSRALYMAANGLVGLGEREKGLEWARRAVAMAPDMLNTWAQIDQSTTPEGRQAVKIANKRNARDRAEVIFDVVTKDMQRPHITQQMPEAAVQKHEG